MVPIGRRRADLKGQAAFNSDATGRTPGAVLVGVDDSRGQTRALDVAFDGASPAVPPCSRCTPGRNPTAKRHTARTSNLAMP